MVTAATTVPAWVWHTTTLAATMVTVALVAVLTAHIVISVLDDGPQTSGPDGADVAHARAALRSRLARVAAVLLAVFLLVVLVRAGILLAERPSR